ncbi:FAD/NAD(P)-binding protein [Asticcacaulis endophyticus]|uniref:FAD-dependent urate hydroxylase HpyO/Asp monooxygenase CreE-like FAD/NAD(P)-binding domain-containing protein n=1 Tax=Asticcacaulis endophyticus TaxID=1395890 RepID=A0A918Q3G6_9CAUL|nr:FAD/NAD(P)-binding protein [Asticcacaulis endophyticus]GGZ30941.1 hypothetical protein GCM10011273_16790 [Asticcacaulis endophyticus]
MSEYVPGTLKPQTIAIVGAGISGTLLALRLSARNQTNGSNFAPLLIEGEPRVGPGLAYGAADEVHLLNVPVSRMEVGFTPSFETWLGAHVLDTAAATAESGGDLSAAFVGRKLFGQYVYECAQRALRRAEVNRVRGRVTQIDKTVNAQHEVSYSLSMSDGRSLRADKVVLATGNDAPKAPALFEDSDGRSLQDSALFIPDPWQRGAFNDLDVDEPVLLIGTGLTAIDIALKLHMRGHKGQIWAVSRRGLLPKAHKQGGDWPGFLEAATQTSPIRLLQRFRQEARRAGEAGIPWQRVMDAARPYVAQIWSGWSTRQRRQFLRHVRPHWDIHRHRLAPRIQSVLTSLHDRGQFVALAGRLVSYSRKGEHLTVKVRPRHKAACMEIKVARVVNCTGPRSDYGQSGDPLFVNLREQGLIQPDLLGLGIETSDARVIDGRGQVSDSLFALGPLTRPSWWEITAVPEISVQVSRLIDFLHDRAASSSPVEDFFDLGAGI